MTTEYANYFKGTQGCAFTGKDIATYQGLFLNRERFIRKRLTLAAGLNVLEIGSGIGGFYSMLPDGVRYSGIELDPDAVVFANVYFKVNCFSNVSLEEYTATDEFDRVYAYEVLEHLVQPLGGIEKIHSLLKQGGFFCGTTPYPFKKTILIDKTHKYVLHPLNWERIFEQSGFVEVRLYPMTYLPVLLWRISGRLNPRIPLYVPFRLFFSTCLFIAKKG